MGIISGISPLMGMINCIPTLINLGSTLGLAAFRSSNDIPYWNAIPSMVSSFFTVCMNGVGVGAGVTGMIAIWVDVGETELGVIVWYGVIIPVGTSVGVGCMVACVQLLNKNPSATYR